MRRSFEVVLFVVFGALKMLSVDVSNMCVEMGLVILFLVKYVNEDCCVMVLEIVSVFVNGFVDASVVKEYIFASCTSEFFLGF